LGPYLAGLIEADGSFAIHDKNSKAKRYLPKILIVFNLNDSPLADKLISITKVGKLYRRQKQGCVI
jgi:LAGLIDADG endonuclease